VLKRNPRAFNPKFKAIESPSKVAAETRHVKGCNCKNSRCQKNYCECFQMGVECNSKCKCENCLNGKHDENAHDARRQRLGLGAAEGELAGELDLPDAHILLDGVQQQLKTEEPRHYASGGMSGSMSGVMGGGMGGGMGGLGGAAAREEFHGRELLEMHSLMCSEDLPEVLPEAAGTLQVTSIEVLPTQYGITS
jgi:hypothetical protein